MAEGFDPSPRLSKRRRIATREEDKPSTLEAEQATSTVSKKGGRPGSARTTSRAKSRSEQPAVEPTTTKATPVRALDETEGDETAYDGTQTRSSGRQRKKPRRFSASPEPSKSMGVLTNRKPTKEDEAAQPEKKQKPATPKGILTPSRKERPGIKKTVAFGSSEDAIEVSLGFKDIDSSKKKTDTRVLQATNTATPTAIQKRGKSTSKVAPEVLREDPVLKDTQSEQQEEDDFGFDQILEAQQWRAEAESTPAKAVASLSLEDDPPMLSIKFEVLSRLHSSSNASLNSIPVHLENQYRTIHSLLTATITAGESNSLLVLGSRGSGKSHVLSVALEEMRAKYAEDFHTVRLNGFFQTDDKLALREIWRQLGREMDVDEDETQAAGSYAETMASLLSLLSHPDEFLEPTTNGVYADASSPARISKSIIFILDEFDLFTTHPRQTLLYNLFDIAQSRKAPIAVIGCSTRMDVVECLEKRVKSRFSHRWVHLPSAKSPDGLEGVLKTALMVDEQFDSHGKRSTKKEVEARKRWNTFIKTHFVPSKPVQDLIKRVFHTTKSVPDLFTSLYLSIAAIHIPVLGEAPTDLRMDWIHSLTPQLIDILSSLPTLQLSLLVAASRLDAIHNLGAFNFNLVYDHYTELIARSRLQQTASGAVAVGAGFRQWTHDMAQEAWEDLGEWSLIVPVSGNSGMLGGDSNAGNAGGGEGANVRMWRADVTLDDLVWALKQKSEAGGVAVGAVEVLGRWCREI